MIALAGAHRAGKTTLAKAFADLADWTHVPSRMGEVFKRMGLKVGQPMHPNLRLEVQEAGLDLWVEDITAAAMPWIADRSPLDYAAYVLADLGNAPEIDGPRAMAYVERCFEEANRYCGVIALVQPGIPYVEEEGKPPALPLGQEHFNAVVWGLMCDTRLEAMHARLPRHMTDLEMRVKALIQFNTNVRAQIANSRSDEDQIH